MVHRTYVYQFKKAMIKDTLKSEMKIYVGEVWEGSGRGLSAGASVCMKLGDVSLPVGSYVH